MSGKYLEHAVRVIVDCYPMNDGKMAVFSKVDDIPQNPGRFCDSGEVVDLAWDHSNNVGKAVVQHLLITEPPVPEPTTKEKLARAERELERANVKIKELEADHDTG